MTTAVVAGAAPSAPPEAYRPILDAADIVVGADGGALLCLDAGVVPALAVGDFDSTGPDGLARLEALGVPTEVHAVRKDLSDLDLAVAAAVRLGAVEITVTAAFAGRVDHTLAALGTLLRPGDVRVRAVEPGWWAEAVSAEGGGHGVLEFRVSTGALVSLVSPGGASGVTTEGLDYPLAGGSLRPLSSYGISNVATDGTARVRVSEGSVLVIVSTDP